MKAIQIFKHTFALALAGAFLCFAEPVQATVTTTAASLEFPQGVKDNDTRSSSKAKANKPAKRSKAKKQKTNHGPKKALFPQVHRKADPLSRMSYRDTYKNRH